MPHELQKEARKYNSELNTDKTWLLRVGAARLTTATLADLDGRPIQLADSHGTLGFFIGHDRVSAQADRRGGAMLKDMNQYRLVWKSTLTRKQKVDRYYSLVVARALWGIHLLRLLPPDLAYS